MLALILATIVYLLPLIVLVAPKPANIAFIALPLLIAVATRSPIATLSSITLLPLVHNVQAFIVSFVCSLAISSFYMLGRGLDTVYIALKSAYQHVKLKELLTNPKLHKTLLLAVLLAYIQAIIAELCGYKLSGFITGITVAFSSILSVLFLILLWRYYELLDITLLASFTLSVAWSTPALTLLPLALIPPSLVEYLPQTRAEQSIEFGEIVAILEKKPLIRYQKSLGKGFKWWWSHVPFKPIYHYNVLEETNQHIAIFGASGSGKSTLASTILLQLHHTLNVKFIVVDLEGEYKSLIKDAGYRLIDASETTFNPLVLITGETPAERAKQIVDIIHALYRIGPFQASILEEAILDAYALHGLDPYTPYMGGATSFPNPLDIVKILSNYYSSSGRASIHSLLKYVKGLLFYGNSTLDIDLLLKENVVLDLHRLPTPTHQLFYVEAIARLLIEAFRREGRTSKLRRVIVVDDAHTLLPRSSQRESPFSRLFVELRKYGVMGIFVIQNPLDIDERILANTSLKISLVLNEPKTLNYVARILAEFDIEDRVGALKAILASLPRGYAVVKPPTLSSPLLIRLKTPISAGTA